MGRPAGRRHWTLVLLPRLGARERQVFALFAKGRLDKQIAADRLNANPPAAMN